MGGATEGTGTVRGAGAGARADDGAERAEPGIVRTSAVDGGAAVGTSEDLEIDAIWGNAVAANRVGRA